MLYGIKEKENTINKNFMSLITLLIAIIIAGGLSYLVKIAPFLTPFWKGVAYLAIGVIFVIWLLKQLRAAGIDMTI